MWKEDHREKRCSSQDKRSREHLQEFRSFVEKDFPNPTNVVDKIEARDGDFGDMC